LASGQGHEGDGAGQVAVVVDARAQVTQRGQAAGEVEGLRLRQDLHGDGGELVSGVDEADGAGGVGVDFHEGSAGGREKADVGGQPQDDDAVFPTCFG